MKKVALYLSLFLSSCGIYPAAAQNINTFAGNGIAGYSGDGVAATSTALNTPYGVATDAAGNVYIADCDNNRIRKVNTSGIISTVAGTSTAGFSGDGAAATAAQLRSPRGIATDAAGNIIFSDYGNNRVRKISTTGDITTIAGTGATGFAGDGGAATAALVNYPWGIATDAAGNVYIADQLNCRVRKINTAGIISTVAGNGICAYTGDGMAAISSGVQYPLGVALDAAGNMYIADNGNNRVRKVNTAGIISTIAGSAIYGFSGDGGPSSAAQLYYPRAVATDGLGNIYITDVNNERIRRINSTGIISTLTGTGVAGFSGDGGLPHLAQINQSTGIAVAATGEIYISDNNNNRVRYIANLSHAPYFTGGRRQNLTFCYTEFVYIDSLMSVFDMDAGETINWSIVMPPANGTALTSFSAPSTGSTLLTTGLTYAPALGYIGPDSFSVRVTDGIEADTTMIYVTILPAPEPATVSGRDTVCAGDTIMLSANISGGLWEAGSAINASVSSTGVVTGISAGTTTITYTITTSCGSRSTYFPVTTAPCTNGIKSTGNTNAQRIKIYPNPTRSAFAMTIPSATADMAKVIITTPDGRKVKEMNIATNKAVSVKLDIPTGIYIISAITGSNVYTEKVTITN